MRPLTTIHGVHKVARPTQPAFAAFRRRQVMHHCGAVFSKLGITMTIWRRLRPPTSRNALFEAYYGTGLCFHVLFIKQVKLGGMLPISYACDLITSFNNDNSCFPRFSALFACKSAGRDKYRSINLSCEAAGEKPKPFQLRWCGILAVKLYLHTNDLRLITCISDETSDQVEATLIDGFFTRCLLHTKKCSTFRGNSPSRDGRIGRI